MTQNYVKQHEISFGFDSVKYKGETLNVILRHEDVQGELTLDCESEHANLETFKSRWQMFQDDRCFISV